MHAHSHEETHALTHEDTHTLKKTHTHEGLTCLLADSAAMGPTSTTSGLWSAWRPAAASRSSLLLALILLLTACTVDTSRLTLSRVQYDTHRRTAAMGWAWWASTPRSPMGGPPAIRWPPAARCSAMGGPPWWFWWAAAARPVRRTAIRAAAPARLRAGAPCCACLAVLVSARKHACACLSRDDEGDVLLLLCCHARVWPVWNETTHIGVGV